MLLSSKQKGCICSNQLCDNTASWQNLKEFLIKLLKAEAAVEWKKISDIAKRDHVYSLELSQALRVPLSSGQLTACRQGVSAARRLTTTSSTLKLRATVHRGVRHVRLSECSVANRVCSIWSYSQSNLEELSWLNLFQQEVEDEAREGIVQALMCLPFDCRWSNLVMLKEDSEQNRVLNVSLSEQILYWRTRKKDCSKCRKKMCGAFCWATFEIQNDLSSVPHQDSVYKPIYQDGLALLSA